MKNTIYISILFFALLGCEIHLNKTPANIQDNGLYGLNHYMRVFDFGDSIQLGDLPPFGDDHSYIENKQLKAPIKMGEHKGLGRKFWFDRNGGEPNEVEMEFKIWLPESFQKNGTENEVGKFLGFEGIYDQTAGWGGKKVTNQNSWSVRIGHAREDSEGKIPIGLYIYHPEMKGKYGTSIDTNFALEKEQTHTLKLYIKLNDINQKNGVIKLFVNGEEIYSSNTWLLRKKAWVHTRSVWLNAYIGGLTPSLNDTYVIYDDLKIKW